MKEMLIGTFRLASKYGASFIQMGSVCGHLEPGRSPKLIVGYRKEKNLIHMKVALY